MATLFETTRLKHIELSNRFVRSATWEGLAAPGGYPTEKLTKLLVELALGGVATIITSHAYVSEEGQAGPSQLGIYRDDQVGPLREMAEAVHAAGAKIIAQLSHAGCMAAAQLTGRKAIGPSALVQDGRESCGEMTADDIRRVTGAFTQAARRAKEAGFDGVQIHTAHGYLLSQFLSPLWNKRQDAYGGPVEQRARLLLEVVRAARQAAGEAFVLMVKINCQDFTEGGFTLDDMLLVSGMLEGAAIDAIEMSGGTVVSGDYMPSRKGKAACVEGEAYYTDAARRYKERIRVPLILVGGIRSHAVAEGLVAEGLADYIALCRPLIAEPHLVNRWKSGDREPAACKSDNLCFKPAFEGRGIACVTMEKQRGH
jgi:2,4-dienoyl-CoA reductase-like NADH-dependent reductase (Old Yellow Enzyme family)